ncbi:MAG: hypothetical protein IT304_00290 [Dehalococcoidia bacterium]|nr:hypothetical protein [Dehalococcoidia bacterium]
MSWEDWLTFVFAVVMFLSVAVSIQQARWVRDMPPLMPTAILAVLAGMIAARVRAYWFLIQPLAVLIGVAAVVLAVQTYAEGDSFVQRIDDFQARMNEWWQVVRAGDISNDNLPFVTLVLGVLFLTTYVASFSIFRWHNPWVAILPGGIVILANIAFLKGQPSGAFVFFLFGAILLVARLHLQRSEARWKRQGVEYPDFISLNALQLTLLLAVGLIALAWLMPTGNQAKAVAGVFDTVTSPVRGHSDTFVRLFHNVDSQKGARLHSLGTTLPIQGNVKLGTKELYEIKSPSPGLVRAASYEVYTGNGWKQADRSTQRIKGGELAASPDVAQYEARNVAILAVTVTDGDNTVLSLGMPLGTNISVTAETPKGFAGDIEQLRTARGLNKGDTYNSIGSESVATAEQLAAAGTAYPGWVKERYLQLPKALPQRVREEAARAAAGAATPYTMATRVEEYLRQLPYDLTVSSPPAGQDIVDYFLFDLKRGYFDYHATAMTVMLRSLGIPARLAVGYALDPTEAQATTYTVRKDDAYSWVEVWFPKYGWVNFNPTPDHDKGGSGGLGSGLSPDVDTKSTLGLEDLFGNLGGAGGIAPPVESALQEKPVAHSDPPWALISSTLAILALLAVMAVSLRVAWNWGLRGLEGNTRIWAKTQRLAHWARLGSRPTETPREWSQRMGSALQHQGDASQLADAYEETRYGRPDLQRTDEAATSASYRRLRNTLAATVLRRGNPPKRRTPKP